MRSATDTSDEEFEDGVQNQFFVGISEARICSTAMVKANSWIEALDYLNRQESGLDICELCGGHEARTSQVAIRRRLKTGTNFDLVCGIDLGDPTTQQLVIKYIRDHKVLIVIMAPSCRAVGPTSNLNNTLNYDGWLRSCEADLPHLEFSGQVAILQAQERRFWFAETSWPTWLWTLSSWKIVDRDANTQKRVIHQCRLGVQGPSKLLVRKATEVSSNAPEMMAPFDNLKCSGGHIHDQMWGKPKSCDNSKYGAGPLQSESCRV